MVRRNAGAGAAELLIWGATCLMACVPAVSSQSLLAVMRSCAAQADESARLQCYDRGVAQFKGADTAAGNNTCSDTGLSQPAVSSKSPAVTQVTPPPSANPTPGASADQFGLTSEEALRRQSSRERSPALKKITARIVTLSHRAGGALVVHLDNGQVWEQTEDGPDLHLGAGAPIAIDRGLLGAYWLSPASGHLAVKVRRTQ
jgi:hypothetical protein